MPDTMEQVIAHGFDLAKKGKKEEAYLGSAFVRVYYFVSPFVAKIIPKHELLRAITRQLLLDPVLRLIKK